VVKTASVTTAIGTGGLNSALPPDNDYSKNFSGFCGFTGCSFPATERRVQA
jgi:hypothetical protein